MEKTGWCFLGKDTFDAKGLAGIIWAWSKLRVKEKDHLKRWMDQRKGFLEVVGCGKMMIYPPWKLTWHWKIPIFNRKYIFKWWIFHCHVSFRGGQASQLFLPLTWDTNRCSPLSFVCCSGYFLRILPGKSPFKPTFGDFSFGFFPTTKQANVSYTTAHVVVWPPLSWLIHKVFVVQRWSVR